MVLPYSPKIPRVPGYSGYPPQSHYSTHTGLSPLSSELSISCFACNAFDSVAPHPHNASTSWVWARTSSIASTKVFTCCFLFLRLLRCFSSPGSLCFAVLWLIITGCPIQIFTAQSLFATPRNFSQLITSFFASWSLGIRHPPLSTFFKVFNIFFYYGFTLYVITILLVFIITSTVGLFIVNCQFFIVN